VLNFDVQNFSRLVQGNICKLVSEWRGKENVRFSTDNMQAISRKRREIPWYGKGANNHS